MYKQPQGFTDPWIVKVDSLRCLLNDCSSRGLREEADEPLGVLSERTNPLIAYFLPIEDIIEVVDIAERVFGIANPKLPRTWFL